MSLSRTGSNENLTAVESQASEPTIESLTVAESSEPTITFDEELEHITQTLDEMSEEFQRDQLSEPDILPNLDPSTESNTSQPPVLSSTAILEELVKVEDPIEESDIVAAVADSDVSSESSTSLKLEDDIEAETSANPKVDSNEKNAPSASSPISISTFASQDNSLRKRVNLTGTPKRRNKLEEGRRKFNKGNLNKLRASLKSTTPSESEALKDQAVREPEVLKDEAIRKHVDQAIAERLGNIEAVLKEVILKNTSQTDIPDTSSKPEVVSTTIEPEVASATITPPSAPEAASSTSSSTSSAASVSSDSFNVSFLNVSVSQFQLDVAASLAQANLMREYFNKRINHLYEGEDLEEKLSQQAIQEAAVLERHQRKLKAVSILWKAGKKELLTIADIIEYREKYLKSKDENGNQGRYGEFFDETKKYFDDLLAEVVIQLEARQDEIVLQAQTLFGSLANNSSEAINEDEVVASELVSAIFKASGVSKLQQNTLRTTIDLFLATKENEALILPLLNQFIKNALSIQLTLHKVRFFESYVSEDLTDEMKAGIRPYLNEYLKEQQQMINYAIDKVEVAKNRCAEPDVLCLKQLIDLELEQIGNEKHLKLISVEKAKVNVVSVTANIPSDERYIDVASTLGAAKMMRRIFGEKLNQYWKASFLFPNEKKIQIVIGLLLSYKKPFSNVSDILDFCKSFKEAMRRNQEIEDAKYVSVKDGHLSELFNNFSPRVDSLLTQLKLTERLQIQRAIFRTQVNIVMQLIAEQVELKIEEKTTQTRFERKSADQVDLAKKYKEEFILNGLTEVESEEKGKHNAEKWVKDQSAIVASCSSSKLAIEAQIFPIINGMMKSLFEWELQISMFDKKIAQLNSLETSVSIFSQQTADNLYNTIMLRIYSSFIPLIEKITILAYKHTLGVEDGLAREACNDAYVANKPTFNLDALIKEIRLCGVLESPQAILEKLQSLLRTTPAGEVEIDVSNFDTNESSRLLLTVRRNLLKQLQSLLERLITVINPNNDRYKQLLAEIEKYRGVLQLKPRELLEVSASSPAPVVDSSLEGAAANVSSPATDASIVAETANSPATDASNVVETVSSPATDASNVVETASSPATDASIVAETASSPASDVSPVAETVITLSTSHAKHPRRSKHFASSSSKSGNTSSSSNPELSRGEGSSRRGHVEASGDKAREHSRRRGKLPVNEDLSRHSHVEVSKGDKDREEDSHGLKQNGSSSSRSEKSSSRIEPTSPRETNGSSSSHKASRKDGHGEHRTRRHKDSASSSSSSSKRSSSAAMMAGGLTHSSSTGSLVTHRPRTQTAHLATSSHLITSQSQPIANTTPAASSGWSFSGLVSSMFGGSNTQPPTASSSASLKKSEELRQTTPSSTRGGR